MTEHPITPLPELVEKWIKSARYREFMPYPEGYEQYEQRLTTIAARWGADMELEACCEWLEQNCGRWDLPAALTRAARRPQPPNLKEQALALLDKAEDPRWDINDFSIVRKALEQLND